MWEHLEFIVEKVIEHWPLLAATSLFWTLGNLLKKVLPHHSKSKMWSWVWRVFPFYPLLLGMIVGALPWAPVPESVKALGGFTAFMYYSLAGVLATYVRDIISTLKKYKIVIPRQE